MDIDTLFVLCMDNEKYEQLKKKFTKDLRIITHGPEIMTNKGVDIENYLFDFEKYLNENSYEKMIREFNFNESLNNTIDWYLDNLSWCKTVSSKSNFNANRIGLIS